MKGLDEFLNIFGNVTVLQVVEVILAGVFLFCVYKKFRAHLIQIHETDKVRDEQLKEALEGVRKYPEYRQQSIEIQKELVSKIHKLQESQEQIVDRLTKMEENSAELERNKLRDRLLQSYRYYTNKDNNPSQTWTEMESEAFWELFKDYEKRNGNGFMHEQVKPAMLKLTVVEHRNGDE